MEQIFSSNLKWVLSLRMASQHVLSAGHREWFKDRYMSQICPVKIRSEYFATIIGRLVQSSRMLKCWNIQLNLLFFIVLWHLCHIFGIVSKAEIDVFLELSCFSMIQRMLEIWSLVPLLFLKPAWTSGSSWFTYCWSLAWRILSITLQAWDECNCVVVWAIFGIAFLRDWNENWPFPVLWPLLRFPNLLTYWVQHFHSIIF